MFIYNRKHIVASGNKAQQYLLRKDVSRENKIMHNKLYTHEIIRKFTYTSTFPPTHTHVCNTQKLIYKKKIITK